MLKVAMLSMWHVHAKGYAEAVNAQKDARVTAVWDEDAARGQEAAKALGVPFEADLDALLRRDDVDAVLVDTPTTLHEDVMLRAAAAGKHIFTEKALAPTVAACERIAAAIRHSGIKFCISFPRLTAGTIVYAKQAIDAGKLGQVTYLRIRLAHGGASQGWLPAYWYDEAMTAGGAMMDLGCHPNYLANYLLGKPARVVSIFNRVCCPPPTEDNAVSVVEFENKAIAVLETGFVSPYSAFAVEIHGTEGSIYIEGDTLRIRSNPAGINGWLTPAELPKGPEDALRQWIDGILYDKPIVFGLPEAIGLTALLEAEYAAARDARVVTL